MVPVSGDGNHRSVFLALLLFDTADGPETAITASHPVALPLALSRLLLTGKERLLWKALLSGYKLNRFI